MPNTAGIIARCKENDRYSQNARHPFQTGNSVDTPMSNKSSASVEIRPIKKNPCSSGKKNVYTSSGSDLIEMGDN